MNPYQPGLLALSLGVLLVTNAQATNPLIMDQFTADPTARVFEGKLYVYPSHDIPATPGRGRPNWFVMEDYHVFSSENLTDWTDHGAILNQTNVPWLNRATFDMWAPDCLFKSGKYYFYFPVGGRIGVAVADKPDGPFKPELQPIAGANGIDPGLLMDKDGTAYMFWARGRISVARLKANMVELDSPPEVVSNLPTRGLIEGPFPFERNGIYYLTYPHVQNRTERLEYATSTSAMGPYTQRGVFLDEAASGCWTVHQSVVEYQGQWYLFYHDKDLSPNFDKNRSIKADYLYFNEDGTIKKVIPTLRGVGKVNATSQIQIDRYSAISPTGVTVSFLNASNTFAGWQIALNGKITWVQFDRVDFGQDALKAVSARARSATGGTVEIHLDKADGPLMARITAGADPAWQMVHAKLDNAPKGLHDIVVTHDEENEVALDWISFE